MRSTRVAAGSLFAALALVALPAVAAADVDDGHAAAGPGSPSGTTSQSVAMTGSTESAPASTQGEWPY